jgi:sugar (pentulose or hexulose) kinase
MDASMPAAKVMWLRHAQPERWEHTRLITGVKDALRHRMTGDTLTDPVDATATSLFDIRAGTWSSVVMEVVGIEEDRPGRFLLGIALQERKGVQQSLDDELD